mgnify:FL=1
MLPLSIWRMLCVIQMGTEEARIVTQVARIRCLALEVVLRVRELTGKTTARNLERIVITRLAVNRNKPD